MENAGRKKSLCGRPSSKSLHARGIVLICASLLTAFLCVGLLRMLSLVYVEVQNVYETNASQTSLLFTCFWIAFSLCGLLVNSFLGDIFNEGPLVMMAGFISLAGHVIASLTRSPDLVIFPLGLCSGAAMTVGLGGCLTALGRHFKTHLPLVTSLALAGSALAGFILPPIIQYLLEAYTLHGAILIIGGYTLNLVVTGAVLSSRDHPTDNECDPASTVTETGSTTIIRETTSVPRRAPNDSNPAAIETKPSLDRSTPDGIGRNPAFTGSSVTTTVPSYPVPNKAITIPTISAELSENPSAYLDGPLPSQIETHLTFIGSTTDMPTISEKTTGLPSTKRTNHRPSSLNGANGSFAYNNTGNENWKGNWKNKTYKKNIVCRTPFQGLMTFVFKPGSAKKTSFKQILGLSLWKYPLFVIYQMFTLLAVISCSVAQQYLPANAEDIHFTPTQAAYLLSAIGAADLAGRLLFGVLCHLRWFEHYKIFMVSQFILGGVVVITPFVRTFEFQILLSVAVGVQVGIFYPAIPVTLSDFFGRENLFKSIGINQCVQGIGSLIATTFTGYLRDETGTYTIPFVVSGSCSLLASAVLFGIALRRRAKLRKTVDLTVNTTEVTPTY